MFPAIELLLNIDRAYAKALVHPSFLHSIILIVGIDMVYNSFSSRNLALKVLNQCERTHYLRMLLSTGPKTFSITSRACNKSLVISHIDCFRSIEGICQPFLIQRAIVTNLNFAVSPTSSAYTFSRYSKLSHDPISLQLVLCFFIHTMLKEVISFSFFCNTSYETEIPRWFKRVIALTLVLAQYKYSVMKSGK